MFQDVQQLSQDTLTQSIVYTFITTKLVDLMKESQWKIFAWIGDHAPTTVRAVSTVMATLAAANIARNWDAEHGTLTITGLTAANVYHFSWLILQNVAVQDAWHKLKVSAFFAPKNKTVVIPTESVTINKGDSNEVVNHS